MWFNLQMKPEQHLQWLGNWAPYLYDSVLDFPWLEILQEMVRGWGGAASPDIFRSLWWAEMRSKPLRTSHQRPLKCTTSWGRYSVEVAYETWAFCATICIELPSPFAAPFLYFPWLESSVSVTLGADDNLYIICRSLLLISLQAVLSCAQCKLLLCNNLKDCWKNVWPLLQTPLLSLNL